MVKNLPAMRETWFWSLGWEDPLEEGMTTHSSILAWRIPRTEEPCGLWSMGSQRVRHDWVTKHNTAYPSTTLSFSSPLLKISGQPGIPRHLRKVSNIKHTDRISQLNKQRKRTLDHRQLTEKNSWNKSCDKYLKRDKWDIEPMRQGWRIPKKSSYRAGG